MYSIIDLQLNDLRNNLKDKHNKLSVYKNAEKLLLLDSAHREWGARPLRRNIQNLIENAISEKFISGEFIESDGKILVDGKNGNLIFTQELIDQSLKPIFRKNKKPAKKTVSS